MIVNDVFGKVLTAVTVCLFGFGLPSAHAATFDVTNSTIEMQNLQGEHWRSTNSNRAAGYSGQAVPKKKYDAFGNYGVNFLVQKSSDGKSSDVTSPAAYRIGIRDVGAEHSWSGDISYEYTRVNNSEDGTATVTVSSRREIHLLWLRWIVLKQRLFSPTVSLGQGAFQDQVTTRFYGTEETNKGKFEWLTVGALGGLFQFAKVVELNTDIRVLASPRFSPNPVFGASAAIGFHF